MKIRIWKLGSLDHKIYPTTEAIDKLRNILKDGIASRGDVEVIWDQTLDCMIVEIDDDVDNYIVNADGKLEKINA